MNESSHPAVRADERRREWSVSADVVRVASLLADDLVYIHTTGLLDTKASLLERLRTGDLTYHHIDVVSQQVWDYGSVARIAGTMDIDVVSSAVHKTFNCRFVQEWVEKDSDWQLAYWQSTRLPDP